MDAKPKFEQNLSKKIARNTFFNIIGRLWYFLVTLFLTPYIIGHLGVERFGIWALVGVLTGYFGLLDLGVGFAFIKYIAEFYAKKDYEKINQVINTGFVFYFLISIIIIVLTPFVIEPLIHLLKIPTNLHNEASLVFLLGFIFFAIINVAAPHMAIQSGIQRIDITNKVDMVMSIPNIIGTIFVLENGYGLPGIMVISIIVFLIRSVVKIIINYRILPELRFNPFSFSKSMFKTIFNYGYKLQVAFFATMISEHFDKLLISSILSIGLVTFYQLGNTIVGTIRRISVLLVTPLIPAFSEIHAKEQRRKLIDGYTKGTKYFALFAIPLFIFMIISAPQIMMIWMGPGYDKAVWIIQILGIGWLAAVLASISSAVAQSIARTDIEMKFGLIITVLNIPLSIFFIIKFGFAGVAFGTSLALFCAVFYYFIKLHRELNIPLGIFLKITILKPLIICLCIGFPLWKLSTIFISLLLDLSRISSLIIFVIQAIAFFSLYLVVLFFVKPLDNVDRNLLQDKLPFAKRLIINLSK